MRAQVPLQHRHARVVRHERRVQTRGGHGQRPSRRVAPGGREGRHRVRGLDSRRLGSALHRRANRRVQRRRGQKRGDDLGAENEVNEVIVQNRSRYVPERGEGVGAKRRVGKRERNLSGGDGTRGFSGDDEGSSLRLGNNRASHAPGPFLRLCGLGLALALIAPFAPPVVIVVLLVILLLLFRHGVNVLVNRRRGDGIKRRVGGSCG